MEQNHINKRKIYFKCKKSSISIIKPHEKKCIRQLEQMLVHFNIVTICSKNKKSLKRVACKYIKRNKHKYKNIAIFNSESTYKLEREYAQALRISIKRNPLPTMKEWAIHNDSWLFIYQNVHNPDTQKTLQEFLASGKGTIIILSPLKNWSNEIINLDTMDLYKITSFIRKIFITIALIVGLIYFYPKILSFLDFIPSSIPVIDFPIDFNSSDNIQLDNSSYLTYKNDKAFKFEFPYPSNWNIKENESLIIDNETYYDSITLYEDTNANIEIAGGLKSPFLGFQIYPDFVEPEYFKTYENKEGTVRTFKHKSNTICEYRILDNYFEYILTANVPTYFFNKNKKILDHIAKNIKFN